MDLENITVQLREKNLFKHKWEPRYYFFVFRFRFDMFLAPKTVFLEDVGLFQMSCFQEKRFYVRFCQQIILLYL